jgi:hypothetical protein
MVAIVTGCKSLGVNFSLEQAMKAQRGSRGIDSSTISLTSALDGGGWSTPRPGRFTPRNDPVPIVQEAQWAPGPVTGTENLAPTGIRSPDRPAHSESLYRLSYPDPPMDNTNVAIIIITTPYCWSLDWSPDPTGRLFSPQWLDSP